MNYTSLASLFRGTAETSFFTPLNMFVYNDIASGVILLIKRHHAVSSFATRIDSSNKRT